MLDHLKNQSLDVSMLSQEVKVRVELPGRNRPPLLVRDRTDLPYVLTSVVLKLEWFRGDERYDEPTAWLLDADFWGVRATRSGAPDRRASVERVYPDPQEDGDIPFVNLSDVVLAMCAQVGVSVQEVERGNLNAERILAWARRGQS